MPATIPFLLTGLLGTKHLILYAVIIILILALAVWALRGRNTVNRY